MKSSTEAELVGVSDVMPQVLWTRYSMPARGYTVSGSLIYQDNQSAMLLEKNGCGSSSKWTRHINIRYFFVVDRIANGEVKVEYCPTGDMLADFFTKPLQGCTFQKFRNQIMNLKGDYGSKVTQDRRSVLGGQLKAMTNTTGNITNIPTTSAPKHYGPQTVRCKEKNER